MSSAPRQRRGLAASLHRLRQYEEVFGPRGRWLALRTRLTRRAASEFAPIPGADRKMAIRLNTSDLDTFIKIFVHKEYDIPLAREPRVIIDAGANIGCATIFFAVKFPKASIIAIEPENSNFEILKRNTTGLANVTLLHGALWPHSGSVDLLDPGMGSWGFEAAEASTAPPAAPKIGSVRAFTVNEIMATYNFDFVDVLKIDIEGGEKALFAGSPSWLQHVGVVMIELHDHRQMGCSRNFYIATRDFDHEIRKGENVFALRRDYVAVLQKRP